MTEKVHFSCHFCIFIFDHYVGPVTTRDLPTVGPSAAAAAALEELPLSRTKRKLSDTAGATFYYFCYCVCRTTRKTVPTRNPVYSVVKNQASRCPYRPWIAFWKSLRVSQTMICQNYDIFYPHVPFANYCRANNSRGMNLITHLFVYRTWPLLCFQVWFCGQKQKVSSSDRFFIYKALSWEGGRSKKWGRDRKKRVRYD